ncbi:CDP-glucose 4,6-dehydratase [Pseudoalteromonas sp. J010]|uniref:CDP-glucose 4,6-dehydratase n=1 Tax=Pseudoalteromonas sp. J010 TaxID=998465 RepID=UPI000F652AC4|nr:CDP-glucose 4,6-dehydratase [Pseudoalteromonas sp. J010]RRS09038.1 CDP-glucose 4,6-dehydratase [Pseudoalteromonas sp. J010]
MFNEMYAGKKVLVTGHSGFKGSWLCLWLELLGAEVAGLSLPEDKNSTHYNKLGLTVDNYFGDIAERGVIDKLINDFEPDIIFHLAAQPLVRKSYNKPEETWQSNLTGTLNLLECARHCTKVKAIVVVTTDKVYENNGEQKSFTVEDRLMGSDPYSASKAACEVLVHSYRESYYKHSNTLVATARAGNVIGGGDWSDDRLVPDIIRKAYCGDSLSIRYPNAVRPWQHVLESIAGYLQLGERLLIGDKVFARAWNFGPAVEHLASVSDVLSLMSRFIPNLDWKPTHSSLYEAEHLALDSSETYELLKWKSIWPIEQVIEHTAQWYREYYINNNIISTSQLNAFINDSRKIGAKWCQP